MYATFLDIGHHDWWLFLTFDFEKLNYFFQFSFQPLGIEIGIPYRNDIV